MAERHELRVSDRDRQAAADTLRVAHDEGRLGFAEYDERLGSAYSSVTYGDLDRLFVDLPAAGGLEVAHVSGGWAPSTPPVRARAIPAAPSLIAALPTPLKVLWIVWASVVAINLTVWLLVSLTAGGPIYFWPMWLAVPGAALLVTSGAMLAAGDDLRPTGTAHE